MVISWGIVLIIIVVYSVNHIILGIIKGLYRYKMINKYVYDYYDLSKKTFLEKLQHNIRIETFKIGTVYFSIALTIIESSTFLKIIL